MEVYAGQFSPIVRTTKYINIYKQYLNQDSNINESQVEYNPNITSSTGPSDIFGTLEPGVPLGRSILDIPTYGNLSNPEFQSGVIFVDPGLRLLKALYQERNLLSKVGLDIDPLDEVHVIKDELGNIKGAMASRFSNMGQITKIKYIDVDPDSSNFNKCMCRLFNVDPNSSLVFTENDNIIRNDILPEVIID